MSATHLQIEKADIVVLVCVADAVTELVEEPVVSNLKASGTPFIAVLNKADTLDDPAQAAELLEMDLGVKPLIVSAASGQGIPEMLDALLDKVPADFGQQSLLGGLVSEGDLVVLVMPQDSEAPKGRLIMPQARVIREFGLDDNRDSLEVRNPGAVRASFGLPRVLSQDFHFLVRAEGDKRSDEHVVADKDVDAVLGGHPRENGLSNNLNTGLFQIVERFGVFSVESPC